MKKSKSKQKFIEILENKGVSHANAVACSENGLTDTAFEILLKWYCDKGIIPYEVAKAKTGDPYIWIWKELFKEVRIELGLAWISLTFSIIFVILKIDG